MRAASRCPVVPGGPGRNTPAPTAAEAPPPGCGRVAPRPAPPRSDALSRRPAGTCARRGSARHSSALAGHVPFGARLTTDPRRVGPQEPRQRRSQPPLPAGRQEEPGGRGGSQLPGAVLAGGAAERLPLRPVSPAPSAGPRAGPRKSEPPLPRFLPAAPPGALPAGAGAPRALPCRPPRRAARPVRVSFFPSSSFLA